MIEARIEHIEPGSVAEELGLEPGNVVLEINGNRPRDIIDFRFLTASGEFTLLVEKEGELVLLDISLDDGEYLGISFTEPVFDGLRHCHNHCRFCFVRNMPPGLRPSLYLRDDDYRYSFLYGNFVTLTNLQPGDWKRITQQRLSPLYVSVHATEQYLRNNLLGVQERPPVVKKLRWLAGHGIDMHVQLVLLPGTNDGEHLDRSLADLHTIGGAIASISVVPVGLTRYAPADLRTHTVEEAKAVIAQVEHWRPHFQAALRRPTVFAADEWFLLAGTPIPGTEYYEDFPQVENGVGLVRSFLDDWQEDKRNLRNRGFNVEGERAVVCGELIAPIWEDLAREMIAFGVRVKVLPVPNRLFGSTVTVSGLLSAGDVIAALQEQPAEMAICLPRSMFDAEGALTLDGYSVKEIESALDRPVYVCSRAADVLTLPAGSSKQIAQ